MRAPVFLVALFLASSVASGAELPSLICREGEVLSVEPRSLNSHSYSGSALYRFTRKGLYLSDKDREEYFYNPRRYWVPVPEFQSRQSPMGGAPTERLA
jgi:hypothetical protein